MTDPLPPELALDEPLISDDVLTGPPEDTEHVVLGGWEEVEWAFRRLARSRVALDQLADRYAEMVGRIEQWYEREAAADRRAVDYLTGLLERYGEASRLLDPRTATLRFPSGTIKTTWRKEPRVVIEDEQAAIAWVLLHLRDEAPEMLHQKLTLRITELRKRVQIADDTVITSDGEVVEGVTVEPPAITATIELSQEDADQ